MKKILILAYYFRPSNTIGANRPNSWAEHFSKLGYEITVVCRHWDGSEKTWEEIIGTSHSHEIVEKNERGYRVFYLPYKKYEYPKLSLLAKLNSFWTLFTGQIQPETDGNQYLPFLRDLLKKEKFDLVLPTAEPYNLIRVGWILNREFGVPYVSDFRDFEDHFVLAKDPSKNSLFKKFEFECIKFYTKKWCSRTAFISSICEPIADFLGKLCGKKSILITNGYEASIFDSLVPIPNSEQFQFTVLGTIYPRQTIEPMLGGIQIFLEKVKNPRIRFNFIGLETIASVAEQVRAALPPSLTNITNRIPREQALNFGREAHVLFYPGFHQYTGFYSGKIFEYLGLRKNVLISPGDEAVIDRLVARSAAGKIAPDAAAFAQILMNWYSEWEATGALKYFGKEEVIAEYSRENQADLLLSHISQI